ncbi:MAG: hypothetical protein WKF61_02555 [Luteimonas sp.]
MLSIKSHKSTALLLTGFLVQILMSSAAIAIGIEYDIPKWLYASSLVLSFLCGAVFLLTYRYERPSTRMIAASAYVLSSAASIAVLTLFLFCSLKTCS